MKLLWNGTDSLMLITYANRTFRTKVYFWVFRIIIRFLERFSFTSGHYVNHETTAMNLMLFGIKKPIEYINTPLLHNKSYGKIPHKEFNILYDRPYRKDEKFRDLLYGSDLIHELMGHYEHPVNFIRIDGSQNLANIYPIVDMYIRPNRNDGNSRIVRECEIQKIPYYWSQTNPDFNEMKKRIDGEIKKSGKV